MQQLLQIVHAQTRWVMYRPFLHYFSSRFQPRDVDRRSYACGVAAVYASQELIRTTVDMYRKRVLSGSYWFVTSATYFAILTVVFFILENPDLPKTQPTLLSDALEGKNVLVGLTKNSLAFQRCDRFPVRPIAWNVAVDCC